MNCKSMVPKSVLVWVRSSGAREALGLSFNQWEAKIVRDWPISGLESGNSNLSNQSLPPDIVECPQKSAKFAVFSEMEMEFMEGTKKEPDRN